MPMRGNSAENRTKTLLLLLLTLILCTFFYILGSYKKSSIGRGDSIALKITQLTKCTNLTLNFQTHNKTLISQTLNPQTLNFQPCHQKYTDYTPCHDQKRAMKFPRKNMIYRERHCPKNNKKLSCLIPAPIAYVAPFHWPKSRDYVNYVNVPYKKLTVEKAGQNWVRFEGKVFRFPGGGTQFADGAKRYIDELAKVVPVGNGSVRTVLDTGCGVASFGAYLMDRKILTMSLAPRDSHVAQVQFASERGVPAVIGVLGSIKLPFPSRSFDAAHCSRCLVNWTSNDGMYMMEIDRVLRPGGFWILSGPPINWKNNFKHWKREKEDLEKEQKKIEKFAEILCWEKVSEVNQTAIWRKREGDLCGDLVKICEEGNEDDVWYKKMEICKTLNPKTQHIKPDPFPKRLYSVPPRISSNSIPNLSPNSYHKINELWKKRVNYYKRVNKLIGTDRYRNVMDMNCGTGGFAAALESEKLWVMNVVPVGSDELADLGVVYERGLIGIYHDWCEAFSTYPRTYDLIHADQIFTMYQNKCKMEEILLEMDRILRPEGSVIIRDKIDILIKVQNIASRMRWNTEIKDNEDGPHASEKKRRGRSVNRGDSMLRSLTNR
ncbi:hypothetical protein LUZ60_006735 [Juncus effusus]|nr:hypothetical protein LUZ60_006735 [Juncus effusus]